MFGKAISISNSAKKLVGEKGITDVTFDLRVMEPAGCCVGIIKEIEARYGPVGNATGYRMYRAGETTVFVSREIKLMEPLALTTEGFWRSKRLALRGATIPL